MFAVFAVREDDGVGKEEGCVVCRKESVADGFSRVAVFLQSEKKSYSGLSLRNFVFLMYFLMNYSLSFQSTSLPYSPTHLLRQPHPKLLYLFYFIPHVHHLSTHVFIILIPSGTYLYTPQ